MPDEIKIKAKAGQRRTAQMLKDETPWKGKGNMQHMKSTDPSAFNEWAEEKFVALVMELIGEDASGRVRKGTIMQECAYEIKVSSETVKRYIFKHTARKAEFREFDGWIFLNPKYVPPEPLDDEP
jgi:hypothetical protein